MNRDWLHVTQIALGVTATVLVVGMYVRPVPPSGLRQTDSNHPNIHRTVYLVDVKYLTSNGKEK